MRVRVVGALRSFALASEAGRLEAAPRLAPMGDEEDVESLRRKLQEKEKLIEVQNVRLACGQNLLPSRPDGPLCLSLAPEFFSHRPSCAPLAAAPAAE